MQFPRPPSPDNFHWFFQTLCTTIQERSALARRCDSHKQSMLHVGATAKPPRSARFFFISGVAQWLACWAHNPKVRGSKPRSAILCSAHLFHNLGPVKMHDYGQLARKRTSKTHDWQNTVRTDDHKAKRLVLYRLSQAGRAS